MRPDRDAFASSRLLLRQGSLFGVVGGLQLAAEWACFVATTALGLAVVPANLFGRVAAAGLGFWLNGRYTFVAPGATARLEARQFLRYAGVWTGSATASTLAVWALAHAQGLQAAWIGKALVDVMLAGASFLLAKHWIYR